MSEETFFVVDVRDTWRNETWHQFITLWGPENCGYVYSLDRAGRYRRDDLDPGYHYKHRYGSLRALERYPIRCSDAERLAVPVPDYLRERWPNIKTAILLNTGVMRQTLRRHRLVLGDPWAFDKRKETAA